MRIRFYYCLLIILFTGLSSAQAGTKEELVRLQNDVLALQNQFREFSKSVSEKIDGLKTLVVQLKDETSNSQLALKQLASILESQTSGAQSADSEVLREIRALSTKVDDSATRISALAQQLSELKVQYQALNEERAAASSMSPEAMHSQALRDFVQENFDLAIQGFSAYVDNYPGGDRAAEALCYIGEAHSRQNRPSEAISAFTRVINDYPGTDSVATALYKRAIIELAMQEKANAIADFRAVIQDFPATPEAAKAKSELQRLGIKTTTPSKTAPRKSR
ncbi:MAG: tetratricopeptide repeat protein [Acidobacteria bacterium]|nr:tetratricopeptide repeat protein [Acidobacteriota bacterium]